MRIVAAACMAGLVAACGEARPTGAAIACPTWVTDDATDAGLPVDGVVGALVKRSCGGCHSGATPAGGYDVTTYFGVLGRGADGGVVSDDGAALVAGEAQSRALRTIDPATATPPHTGFAQVFAALQRWDVDCSLQYTSTSTHERGILDPGQESSFHKGLVVANHYDLQLCAGCHGADFAGGIVGPQSSCLGCHPSKPTACTTCHGQPPVEGAHVKHVGGGALGKKLACTECHVVPSVYTDKGHLFNDDGTPKQPAQTLTFGALASTATTDRQGPPAFDGETCANVYCHGDAFAPDGDAKVRRPAWAGGADQAACGTCHGLPPKTGKHPASTECDDCHKGIVDKSNGLVDLARHLDGVVDVPDVTNCQGCHGGLAGNAAPPYDLDGNTDPAIATVGAHQAHLGAQHGIAAPVACNECHLVPQKFDDPGHVDHSPPAQVFPSGAGVVAGKDGAAPAYDFTTHKCANVYCHGGGKTLAGDGGNQAPLWTGGVEQIACGACHGIPPKDASHSPSMTLVTCVKCHSGTVDATGKLLVSNGLHINGTADHD